MTDELDQLLIEFRESAEGYAHSLQLDLSGLISRRLKEWGWTQKQLAERADMKESFVSRIIRCKANWTCSVAARLLHALQIRPKLVQNLTMVVMGHYPSPPAEPASGEEAPRKRK